MASTSSGSSKRARVTTNNAIQAATCLVDGCTADLTNCRKYHQRHKVCEAHSKAPQVSINGQKLRFCQQCSRFHSLEEFDDAKRSCRKRLDGHNLRRRKPQPNLLSVHHGPGTTMLHFSGPHVHPAMALAKPPWAGIAKTSSGTDKPFSDEYLAPARLDYSDCAPSLLSSSPSQTSCTTLSHVVHPSTSSVSTTENSSDVGPHHHAFCDREDPHTFPFYWQ